MSSVVLERRVSTDASEYSKFAGIIFLHLYFVDVTS